MQAGADMAICEGRNADGRAGILAATDMGKQGSVAERRSRRIVRARSKAPDGAAVGEGVCDEERDGIIVRPPYSLRTRSYRKALPHPLK